MPNFKKVNGFKMKGYTYPGISPMKGKRKTADQAAAKESKADAMAKMDEFGDMKMKSTDILGKGSFKVDAGSSPATKRSPAKNFIGGILKAAGEGIKEGTKGLGQNLVEEGGKAIVGGAVSAGINAIGKKKEKPERKSADVGVFSGIQMGRKE